MTSISSALAAALILCSSGCGKGESPAVVASSNASTAVPNVRATSVTDTATNASSETATISQSHLATTGSAFTCTPRTLRRNDTLTLQMQTPHGDYLTANQPDGSLFFIVYPRFDDPSRKFSLMPSERFKTTASLRLSANFRAIPWKFGRDTTEVFFTRPGKYVLWVGENLESDINRHAVKCDVVYQP